MKLARQIESVRRMEQDRSAFKLKIQRAGASDETTAKMLAWFDSILSQERAYARELKASIRPK
ncbi:MAG: hypothetical protein LAP61_22620 [Acidobacteriia bacterium]|jgi:hypothetical protein|nr:hypothetical protein [Terriglobia bacterium]